MAPIQACTRIGDTHVVTQSYNLTLQSYDCLILQLFNLTIGQSYKHSILQSSNLAMMGSFFVWTHHSVQPTFMRRWHTGSEVL